MMIQIRRCEKEIIEFTPSIIPKISLSFEIKTNVKIIDARAYLKLKIDDSEFKEIGCLQLDPSWMVKFPDIPSIIKLCTYVPKEVVLEIDRLANSGEIKLCLDAFFLSHEHGWISAYDFSGAIPYQFIIYSSEWKKAKINLIQEKRGHIRELKNKVQINIFEEYANKGAQGLHEKLASFDINHLKAIISHYSLDPTRKTYKWKTKEKIIEFIVSTVESDIKKGKYFLDLSAKNVVVK